MGNITEIASGAPGYSSVLPNSISPLAQTLRLNGYSTAQFGKCHEVPVWQTSPAGPFDAWPTGGGGFEYFYGFIGGEANQWYPTLYEGTTPVELKKTPEQGYHFMADMTDKTLKWIGQQKALTPDKPFFIYFAPGATHSSGSRWCPSMTTSGSSTRTKTGVRQPTWPRRCRRSSTSCSGSSSSRRHATKCFRWTTGLANG
jgi:arylsulfatase A-like enzyme